MAVLEKKNIWGGINMFRNSCSNIGLKNIQLVIRHLASIEGVNVDSFSHLCQLPLHIFMRKKVSKIKNEILWHSLDASTRKICCFIVLPKRPMGCQYINPHNSLFLNVFNLNTNIQIGDVSQVFYSTLYTSKTTQEEDSEKQLQIGHAVIKRMKRLLEESTSRETSSYG
jgi:hypothetical protein